LAARQLAVELIAAVIDRRRPLEEALTGAAAAAFLPRLDVRDRAFARLIAATTLRRRGEIDAVLKRFIERPLPARTGQLRPILLSAATQLLFLKTPPHAAISLAVDQCNADAHARHFAKLANAVLRRVAAEGPDLLAGLDAVTLNVPDWMLRRWRSCYGETVAQEIAAASLAEAPLDLSVKSDAGMWAERLGATLLPTGSIRLPPGTGRVEDLPGYAEGAWWVQDMAASLPARLLGEVAGREVADLCAAPGGKTAELSAAGARVTAVDQSAERLQRLKENLARLSLSAEVVAADAAHWDPGRMFDAVLLDAPCTATGTIRRHPDILHLKRAGDIAGLAELQSRLLDNAARLVRPGGLLVYCTCSLEPEEGEEQIDRFLSRAADFSRRPVAPGEAGIEPPWITRNGDLRTLPMHSPMAGSPSWGMDGFFAARLERQPPASAEGE
jgi:16S rRNA (cytosine967-C5)-methyltransferase